jgi:hypothetical protein
VCPAGDEDVDIHLAGERGERVMVCWRDHLLAAEDTDPERGRMRKDEGEGVVDVLIDARAASRGSARSPSRMRAQREGKRGRTSSASPRTT